MYHSFCAYPMYSRWIFKKARANLPKSCLPVGLRQRTQQLVLLISSIKAPEPMGSPWWCCERIGRRQLTNQLARNTVIIRRRRQHSGSHLLLGTQRCLGCGGWGVSLVQPWGYCNHCTRVQNLPFQQYPFYPNNMCTQVVPMLLKVRGMLQLRTDRAQNPHLAKQTEKIATKEITLRMMSLTQWIQALTQMLHRVAGLSA